MTTLAAQDARESVAPVQSFTPVRSSLLQRKCACGGTPGPTGECAECRKKHLGLQRKPMNAPPVTPFVPPIVHDVLRSPGQPLDQTTRTFMEKRFGHDFADVRVHTDERAAESARAVDALAYTVGRNVVFGAGGYAPGTVEGRRLLAHELTHVAQQTPPNPGALASKTAAEAQAQKISRRIITGEAPRIDVRLPAGTVQRQADKNPLDATAKAIIEKARDNKTGTEDRAVQAVKSIIKAYYSSDESKVDSVVYDDKKAGSGLSVTSQGAGENTTGIIYVGKTFLEGVTERHFARRVLQVGHELEHISQWRRGMSGQKMSAEREFLAFYHEALAAEKPGTGRMQRSTRVALIDAALGYYYCLTTEQQTQYAANKKELLDRRPGEVKASGHPSTDPPKECKRQ